MLRICDDVGKFEWHPSEEGTLIGGCMNGQVLIWDISEYVAKLKSKISIWDHEVVMEKQTDKLHIQDGFIPVLHWSAESNLKSSHKSHVEDLHWLPSNVWVGKLDCNGPLCIEYSNNQYHYLTNVLRMNNIIFNLAV